MLERLPFFGGRNFADDQPVSEDLLPCEMPEDATMHKAPPKRPIHENLLAEMEHKRRQLTKRDEELVEEINAKHEDLASTRMALRAVEDMMRAVRDNPIVPPVIQNMTEKRKQGIANAKQDIVREASRLHRPGQAPPTVVEVQINEDSIDEDIATVLSTKAN